MDSHNAICAQLSKNVSTSNAFSNTRELEDLFYDNGDKCDITFFPPAYIQRYCAVSHILSSPKYQGKIRKVVDFGCSELGFFKHLKSIPEAEQILCVDIDKLTLEMYKNKIEPLTVDFIHMRDKSLTVSVYEGSVADRDKSLENTDAVICIELIEHLYENTLSQVPANIFGYIKPRVAIVTTPNADFNVLFPRMKGFRHPDHKFEWTRQEFVDWANKIVNKYPEYEVSFEGICPGPKGTEHLGCCSQMAVFHRHTDYVIKLPGIEGLFKLIAQETYPTRVDNRSDEDKILDEASYFIRNYQMINDVDEIPLNKLSSLMQNIQIDCLREVLESNNWEIVENEEEGPVIICRTASIMSEYDQSEEENNFDDNDYDDNQFEMNFFNNSSEIEMDLDDEVFVSNTVTNSADAPVVEPLVGISNEQTTQELDSWNREDQNETNNVNTSCDNVREIGSMCSMFLEKSQNESILACPENITDPNFKPSIAIDSVDIEERNGDDEEALIGIDNNHPQLSSTPLKKLKVELKRLEDENRIGSSKCFHGSITSNSQLLSDSSRVVQNSNSELMQVEEYSGVDFLENTGVQSGDLFSNNNNNLNITETVKVLEDDLRNENNN